MDEVVRRFLRVRRDLSHCLSRSRAVVCSTFNLNLFSTEQSLSLFRFQPVGLGRVAHLLEVEGGLFTAALPCGGRESVCGSVTSLVSCALVGPGAALWTQQFFPFGSILQDDGAETRVTHSTTAAM